MGNIFYAILSGLWPFEKEKDQAAQKKIKQGKRPELPEDMRESTDPFDLALIKAMEMSWIQDPEQRASARQVQQYIGAELRRLGVKKEG